MWDSINKILANIDDFVWGVPLMAIIITGGILLTFRLGFLQIRRLGLALKWMVKNEEGGKGEISSFAALCTALSATIGTGNIVGVATAVGAGGLLDICSLNQNLVLIQPLNFVIHLLIQLFLLHQDYLDLCIYIYYSNILSDFLYMVH